MIRNLRNAATSVVAPFAGLLGLLTTPFALDMDGARDLLLKTYRRTLGLLLVAFVLLAIWAVTVAVYEILRGAPLWASFLPLVMIVSVAGFIILRITRGAVHAILDVVSLRKVREISIHPLYKTPSVEISASASESFASASVALRALVEAARRQELERLSPRFEATVGRLVLDSETALWMMVATGQLEEARLACEEAVRIAEQFHAPDLYARSLLNLSVVLRELGDLDLSMASNKQAIEIYRRLAESRQE